MLQLPTHQLELPYGDEFPLALRNSKSDPRREGDNWRQYLSAGINGIQLLWIEGRDVEAIFRHRLEELEGAVNIWFMPCLQISSVEGGIRIIEKYVDMAAGSRAAYRDNLGSGKTRLVVSVYGARYGKSRAFWRGFRRKLLLSGLDVAVIADVVTAVAHNGTLSVDRKEVFAGASIAEMANIFDGYWTFDAGAIREWSNIHGLEGRLGCAFLGGVMPGYNREVPSNGGFVDARGTENFRTGWELAIDKGLLWNHVISWNDVAERHAIWPSNQWSHTRADLNSFYAEKFNAVGVKFAYDSVQCYLTVPHVVYRGDAVGTVLAEALFINPTNSWGRYVVHILGHGTLAGESFEVEVRPNDVSVKLVSIDMLSVSSSTCFLATVHGPDDSLLCCSVPVAVFEGKPSSPSRLRRNYASTPARLWLPPSPGFVLHRESSGELLLHTAATAGEVKFHEIIINGMVVFHGFGQPPAQFRFDKRSIAPSQSSSRRIVPTIGVAYARLTFGNDKTLTSNPVELRGKEESVA